MLSFYLTILEDADKRSDFESLYHNNKKRMYQTAYNILRNDHDTEDAVHNALVGLARNSSKLLSLSEDEAAAYMCRAARNSALELIKGINKRKKLEAFFHEEDGHSDTPSYEEEGYEGIIDTDTVNAAKTCISLLPEKYRVILEMHYAEDLDVRSIARITGLKENTVRKQISRGIELLREMMKKKGYD